MWQREKQEAGMGNRLRSWLGRLEGRGEGSPKCLNSELYLLNCQNVSSPPRLNIGQWGVCIALPTYGSSKSAAAAAALARSKSAMSPAARSE